MPFCDVTLTLKQALPDRQRCVGKDRRLSVQTSFSAFHEPPQQSSVWSCLSSARQSVFVYYLCSKKVRSAPAHYVHGSAARSGRWHIHCAIELPAHLDAVGLENLIRECWAKVEWGYGRILVRDGANAGWVNYMLKDRQKSEFDGFLDCIIIESLHNPIADA